MNYSKKQKFKYEFFVVTTTVLILGVGIHYLIETIVLKKWAEGSVEVWIGIIVGLLIAFLYSFFTKRLDKKFNGWMNQSLNYKRGIVGEEKVFKKLQECLSNDYIIIPSVITGKYGDADIVVVGPTGVIVIEVKNWSDAVVIKNGELWSKKYAGDRFDKISQNPFAQALGQAYNIGEMLKNNNLFIKPVTPLVVFVNNVQWEGKIKSLVCNIDNLDKALSRITDSSDEYTEEVIQKISEAIEKYSVD